MYHQRCQDYYGMDYDEAASALAVQLRDENPELTVEQAEAHSELFVRESRNLSVTVVENGKTSKYEGFDPYARWNGCCFGC